jgi:hypothetical protein
VPPLLELPPLLAPLLPLLDPLPLLLEPLPPLLLALPLLELLLEWLPLLPEPLAPLDPVLPLEVLPLELLLEGRAPELLPVLRGTVASHAASRSAAPHVHTMLRQDPDLLIFPLPNRSRGGRGRSCSRRFPDAMEPVRRTCGQGSGNARGPGHNC